MFTINNMILLTNNSSGNDRRRYGRQPRSALTRHGYSSCACTGGDRSHALTHSHHGAIDKNEWMAETPAIRNDQMYSNQRVQTLYYMNAICAKTFDLMMSLSTRNDIIEPVAVGCDDNARFVNHRNDSLCARVRACSCVCVCVCVCEV